MKKLGIFIAAGALTLSLAACGSGASSTTTTAAAAEITAAASTETTAAGAATELTEISAGMCSTPAILTSIGQSADVDIANTLCTKAGIEVTMNKNITGADLPDDCKTLILAVGGSSKGLGAAGIDADQELARTDALISAAKEKGIVVLALHTGGSARRGTLSDSFITPAFQGCDAAIVVSEGDSDGLMSGILSGNGTPAIYVDNTAGTLDALKTAFGL
ncbi:MAG: DUF6305 family protein [Clostridiaceae bacterium]